MDRGDPSWRPSSHLIDLDVHADLARSSSQVTQRQVATLTASKRAMGALLFAQAHVVQLHALLEHPGTDPHEDHAVAVGRVHVGLDLEHEAGDDEDPE
ncbi:MAG: hypothetical protein V2J42_11005 [Wenzhouxiangella sp.]|jgi:hypothetical protein|nr:hypothetical protein [Wenzhouxiangella sp.]